MMRTVILGCYRDRINFDLGALRMLNGGNDWHFVLVATERALQTISMLQQQFFQQVHIIEAADHAVLESIVQQHLQYVPAQQLHLVSVSEVFQQSFSQLRRQFGLPGIYAEQMQRFTNKVLMKQALVGSNVRCPQYQIFDRAEYQQLGGAYLATIAQQFQFPLFIKPVSLYGSTGVAKLEDQVALQAWAQQVVSNDIEYEINEFIDGTLFHCDSLIVAGQPVYTTVNEYSVPTDQFSKGYPMGSIQLSEAHPQYQRLLAFNENVLSVLQAPDGATHLEVFLKRNDELVFVEVGARAPGALIVPTTERATGVNFSLAHIAARLGCPLDVQSRMDLDYYFWLLVPKQYGTVAACHAPTLKSQYELTWHVKPGDVYQPATTKKDKQVLYHSGAVAAIILVHHSDFDPLYQDFKTAKQWTWLTMAEAD